MNFEKANVKIGCKPIYTRANSGLNSKCLIPEFDFPLFSLLIFLRTFFFSLRVDDFLVSPILNHDILYSTSTSITKNAITRWYLFEQSRADKFCFYVFNNFSSSGQLFSKAKLFLLEDIAEVTTILAPLVIVTIMNWCYDIRHYLEKSTKCSKLSTIES